MQIDRQHPLVALGAGLVLAALANLTYVSWYGLNFISTLAHEMGHAAVSTFGGSPSFPAIRLNGEACACWKQQYVWLALGIWAFCAYLGWECRQRNRRRAKAFFIVAAIYPLFAFTGLFDVLRLLSGHGGELAFAGLCFWRAWTGGFTSSFAERIAYAVCGWFSAGQNMLFHFRLITSAHYRSEYSSNGSFGLVNDYIRVGDDHLGCSLQTVALLMMFVNIIVLPALVLLGVRIWNGPSRAPT